MLYRTAGLRVFLSYSPADQAFAQRLSSDLWAYGGVVSLSPHPISTRSLSRVETNAMLEQIASASAFVIILSLNAIRSTWVLHELQLALEAGIPVIPVFAHPVDPYALPPSLLGLQSVSFVASPRREALEALMELLSDRALSDDDKPRLGRNVTAEPIEPGRNMTAEPIGQWPYTTAEPISSPDSARHRPAYSQPAYSQSRPPRSKRNERYHRAHRGELRARTLQFSAFHPNEIATGMSSTLLVYTFVTEALAQIQADAATFTELGSAPKETRATSTRRVRQGVELTIEPHVEGVTFSPPSDTFIWRGDWRRSLFRLLADPKLNGTTQHGWIDVYGRGMTPIATIDISLSFHHALPRTALKDPSGKAVTANTFDTVFISYSHRDREALRQAREVYDQLEIKVLVDTQIDPGANYEKAIHEMIQAANVFHLLWSRNSAASDYVRLEWADALASDKGERFIRPWYWREPIVHPPADLEARKISFKYERLKRRLHRPNTWF